MNSRPLLLGHRGASRYAPENTIAAFDLALEHGCDGFEFDVRYTSDAHAVVCHDPQIGGRKIESSVYASLSGAAGVSLACADEVIVRYAARAFLDIELKVAGEIGPILAALGDAPRADSFVISSFLPELLDAVYARVQGIALGLICETTEQLARWPTLPLRFVMPHRKLASPSLMEELHAAKKKAFIWTVNEEKEMRRFAEIGADGLISDDTKLLAQVFSRV
jgi:glycerophosphoryl diester phosphodiesterase